MPTNQTRVLWELTTLWKVKMKGHFQCITSRHALPNGIMTRDNSPASLSFLSYDLFNQDDWHCFQQPAPVQSAAHTESLMPTPIPLQQEKQLGLKRLRGVLGFISLGSHSLFGLCQQ